MQKVKVEIINKAGLHARAASKLVELTATFSSDIRVGHERMVDLLLRRGANRRPATLRVPMLELHWMEFVESRDELLQLRTLAGVEEWLGGG